MRFFMNRHYSTAEKIIDSFWKKIIASLLKHPKIIDTKDNSFTFGIYLYNKPKLAEILGDVLKANIPDFFYDKYQQLNAAEKNEFREKIANDYFKFLELSTNKLTNIDIHIHDDALAEFFGGRFDYGPQLSGKITLPGEFFDKDILAKELCNSITAAKQMLVVSLVESNEILQVQNSFL